MPHVVGLGFTFNLTLDETLDVNELLSPDQLQLAAESGLAVLKRRITLNHELADGSKTSDYSTKPISVLASGVGTGAPLLKPKGGTPNKKRKSPKKGGGIVPAGKWVRFKGGWKEMRQKNGRTTEKDFIISGNLMGKRFRVVRVLGNSVIVGWPAGSLQGVAATGLNEQEKGLLFVWSEREQEAIRKAAEFFILQYFASKGMAQDPPPLNLKDL